MDSNLIVVKQLPVIEQQLLEVKAAIQQRVDAALKMVCTEETVKDIKKQRASLNSEFKALEERRKEVKAQVMKPYEDFEAVYKNCAADAYRQADTILKVRIDEVEGAVKAEKAKAIQEWFDEYREGLGIDFVSFADARIPVLLSSSKKKLQEEAKNFLDGVASDLRLIQTQEHPQEILVEYKHSLDVNVAILTVKERHARIQEEQAREVAVQEAQAKEAAVEEAAEAAAQAWTAPAPVVEPEEERDPMETEPVASQVFTCSFTVTGTREQLLEIKKFLNEGGYRYE